MGKWCSDERNKILYTLTNEKKCIEYTYTIYSLNDAYVGQGIERLNRMGRCNK